MLQDMLKLVKTRAHVSSMCRSVSLCRLRDEWNKTWDLTLSLEALRCLSEILWTIFLGDVEITGSGRGVFVETGREYEVRGQVLRVYLVEHII